MDAPPYIFYVYEPAPLCVFHKDGTEETIDTHVGECFYFDAGDTHSAKNIGGTRFREVLVELKE